LCKSHCALVIQQVPEVHISILKIGAGPWIPDAVMVVMIGRLNASQNLTTRRPEGMDISGAFVQGINPFRGGGHPVNITEYRTIPGIDGDFLIVGFQKGLLLILSEGEKGHPGK
jgi:hypothetical protein